MIPVLELKQQSLREMLDAHLQRCGIEHGWQEHDGRLILTVPSQDLLEPARRQAIWALRRDARGVGVAAILKSRPLTVLLILACVLLSVLVEFGNQGEMLRYLTIVPFSIEGQYLKFESLRAVMDQHVYWRLLTPVFLHFSLMHLVFNMLWLWILGGGVESRQGPARLLVLLLTCGVLSNLAQYPVSGPLFGGMSGVVYGLLAYCWLFRKRADAPVLLPVGLYVFMLVWLALGYTGFSHWLGLGRMANAAHLGGLVAGAACGLLALGIGGRSPKRPGF